MSMYQVDMSNDKPLFFVASSVHNVQLVDWLEIENGPACKVPSVMCRM